MFSIRSFLFDTVCVHDQQDLSRKRLLFVILVYETLKVYLSLLILFAIIHSVAGLVDSDSVIVHYFVVIWQCLLCSD